MKRISLRTATLWNTMLVISVMFAAFILPVLPPGWHRITFTIVYTTIFITGILSVEKISNSTLWLFAVTVLMVWISNALHMEVITSISKGINILFFVVIVFTLIKQIASAREVTAGVILSSVAGYLLMGIIFSIFIAFIIHTDPAAFTPLKAEDSITGENSTTSISLYFGYVTLATLGYGDIVPLKPYTRSLATLIAISGQFYIAIIVALLVGKFSVQQHTKKDGKIED
jgi:voltage-gated potassium channel